MPKFQKPTPSKRSVQLPISPNAPGGVQKALAYFNAGPGLSLRKAAAKAGASSATVTRWAAGGHYTAKPGRPCKNSGAEVDAVAKVIRDRQWGPEPQKKKESYGGLGMLAEINGRPYEQGVPLRAGQSMLGRRLSDQPKTSLDAVHGCGGGVATCTDPKMTTQHRQKGVRKEVMVGFCTFVKNQYLGLPLLTAGDIWGFDESQLLNNGEKVKGDAVHYDQLIRSVLGGPRSSAPANGGNRTSVLLAFNAEGLVLPPGFYFSGQYVQEAWTAGPYPPGVTADFVRKAQTIPTKCGVATTDAHKYAIEWCVFAAIREHRPMEKFGKQVLQIDCCDEHGIIFDKDAVNRGDYKFTIVPWLQGLCDKYNFAIQPIPHNTSQ